MLNTSYVAIPGIPLNCMKQCLSYYLSKNQIEVLYSGIKNKNEAEKVLILLGFLAT